MTQKTKSRIVITGAAGWLGRSLINVLVEILGQDCLNQLELYGSRERWIKLQSGKNLFIRNLSSFNSAGDIELFAPFAFMTQEKMNSQSKESYIQANEYLINCHQKIIESSSINSAITFSSGIVSFEPFTLNRPDSFWTYRDLKRVEEDRYLELFSRHGVIYSSCRLFSISGSEMKDPLKYALGNLISQAVLEKKIVVESPILVYRKYVDAEQLCRILFLLTTSGRNTFFESSGEKIEVGSLANLVAEHFSISSDKVSVPEKRENISDEYFSVDPSMEEFFAKYGLDRFDIKTQIGNTAAGLENSGILKNA
jgi:nucleoside-diphosphate-sugar epimerase